MSDALATARYARALFDLGNERNELEKISKTLKEIGLAISRHPEISHLVLNSTISRTEKEDFIDKVFPSAGSRLAIEFVKLLIRKRRFQQFDAMQKAFEKRFDEKMGFREVTVITAVPLTEGTEQKLTRVLKGKLKAEIHLEKIVNPKVLGGLIVRFNGMEINGAFNHRIAKLKQLLAV